MRAIEHRVSDTSPFAFLDKDAIRRDTMNGAHQHRGPRCVATTRARGSARALLVAIALASRRSEAADVPFDIDLVYEAPPQCPARREVLNELRSRVGPSSRADVDRQREPRSFDVRIQRRTDGTFSGRLEVTRPGDAATVKEFQAATCRAVSSALNLFIAIALDPTTSDRRRDDLPPTESPPPPTSTPMEPTPPSAPPPLGLPAPPARPRTSAWVLSSEIGVVYVRAPRDAWGARVSAQVARLVDGARVAPAFRLSWGFADFEERPPNGGRASFRFTSGRAAACALVALAPVPVTLVPCAGLDFGSLAATSSEIVRVGQVSSGWYAMIGVLRAAWSILPWLTLDTEIGVEGPLTRPTFGLLEPVRVIYRPPSALVTAGLGLAITARFP